MKYILTAGLIFFCSVIGKAQTMQASIGAGSSTTRVIIYIKPTTAVNGNIATLQFDVAVPSSTTPAPTLAIVGTPTIGSGWIIGTSYIEDGYRHYEIATGAIFTVNIGAGVETPVMELEFTGGPSTTSNVVLITLPLAGTTTGSALFFCSGAANSVEGQLYYSRAGTTVVNNNSYSGGAASTATLGGVVLPLNWLSFNVIKQGNDGILNWAVVNDDASLHFELQRSINGLNFTTISILDKSNSNNYDYTDKAISNLGAAVLFYRIKEVDINGKISYSDIRTLRLDLKGSQIAIYPNPAKGGFYISIPFINIDSRIIKLNLISASGQLVCSKEITTSQASNYYFDLKGKNLAEGNYNVQVIFEDKILENKKLYINN